MLYKQDQLTCIIKYKMANSQEHSHDDCSKHEHEDDKWMQIERVYEEKSTEEESLINWLTKNVDLYMPSVVADGVTENTTSGGNYSILSFGCGSGSKDRAILAAISSRLSEETKIVYHAVDPVASQIEKFKKAIQNGYEIKESFKKVRFSFFAQTYEDYMQNKSKDEGVPSKANLILFIDSLCHFTSSAEDALVHCYNNVVAQDGVILVTLWNNQDFWFKIREIYGKNRNSERKEEESNDYLTIQEVEEIVKKHGWNFKLFSPEYSLDITECFNCTSEVGKHLLDCLACFSNVKDEVDSDPKKLFNFLQESQSISENEHLLKGKHGTLVIYKQE